MNATKYCCNPVSTDDRGSDDESVDFYQLPCKNNGLQEKSSEEEKRRILLNHLRKLRHQSRSEIDKSFCCQKCSVPKVRHTKKLIRRSSALVKSRRVPVVNIKKKSKDEFKCCDQCDSGAGQRCPLRINIQDSGGSILRGKTHGIETQTLVSRDKSSLLTFSRTKGLRNWRSENRRRKFPCVTKVSSATESVRSKRCSLSTPVTKRASKCCCFSNDRPAFNNSFKKPSESFSEPSKFHQSRFKPRKKLPSYCRRSRHYVVTTASSSDDENVDYQVPITYSRRHEPRTGTGGKTLIPTSSHITIRICSANSSSSLTCNYSCNDQKTDSPHSLASENSLQHLEERNRRGLETTCCCSTLENNGFERKLQTDRLASKNRSVKQDEPLAKDFLPCGKSIPKLGNGKESSKSGAKVYCCKCRKRLSSSVDKSSDFYDLPHWRKKSLRKSCKGISTSDFGFANTDVRSSDEGSFEKFKNVNTYTRRLRRRRKLDEQLNRNRKKSANLIKSNCQYQKSEKEIRNSRNRQTAIKNPQTIVKKIIPEATKIEFGCPGCDPDPPIILSAQQYSKFLDRCERIRKSIRNMMLDECISSKSISKVREPVSKAFVPCIKNESSLYKTKRSSASCVTLDNLRPELSPMEHWSQYEDRMKEMTDEYKRLKSCVDLIESEREKFVTNRGRDDSVTRSYPSGTEFTHKVKRAPEKEACAVFYPKESEVVDEQGNCCYCSQLAEEKCSTEKDRSVWLEKINKEKENCCSNCNEEAKNIEASCATVKAREADLIRTLEMFCEKIKRMKSEFEKPLTSCSKKFSTCCSRCSEKRITKNGGPCLPSRRRKNNGRCSKLKAKKLLIFPPEGEDGPPLTLFKNSSDVNCRVKGDSKVGFQYNVIYVQRFVSSTWCPGKKNYELSVDSG